MAHESAAPDLDRVLRQQYLHSLRIIESACELDQREATDIGCVTDTALACWAIGEFSDGERTFSAEEVFKGLPLLARRLVFDDDAPDNDYFLAGGKLSARVDNLSKATTKATYRALGENLARLAVLCNMRADGTILPDEPQTRLRPEGEGGLAVSFDAAAEFRYFPKRQLEAVATMGPGLTGARFIQDVQGHVPMTFLVSGGRNAHFQHTLAVFVLGVDKVFRQAPSVDPDTVTMHETGVADYFDTLQSESRSLDMVVMSAFHYAGQQVCAQTVRGAYDGLRPGGALVIKAPVKTLCEHEAGLDIVGKHAQALFGEPAHEGECGTMLHHLGAAEGLPAQRAARFMIFEKKLAASPVR